MEISRVLPVLVTLAAASCSGELKQSQIDCSDTTRAIKAVKNDEPMPFIRGKAARIGGRDQKETQLAELDRDFKNNKYN